MKRNAALVVLILAGCGGSSAPPPPLASIAMPAGAALKPFDANPSLPRPEGMALFNGNAYVTLANYDAKFKVRGPGLLAKVVPSTGETTVIDLGGSDERQCLEPGIVREDSNLLYVSCGSDFAGNGQAVVEVDPATNTVKRSAVMPTAPTGVAFSATTIFVGDSFSGDIYKIDRGTFAVSATTLTAPCPVQAAGDSGYYQTVNELLMIDDSLYALCSNSTDGVLSQLDPATGAIKKQTPIGPIAVEMAATSDGRIAVVSGGENTLRLVTIGTTLTVQTLTSFFSNQTSTLQDVHTHGNFLYTAASGSNTVQKIDLNASGGPKIVAETNVGNSANPWNVLPIDDDHAVVSNQGAGTLTGVTWAN